MMIFPATLFHTMFGYWQWVSVGGCVSQLFDYPLSIQTTRNLAL
jgi:hypothetical protein